MHSPSAPQNNRVLLADGSMGFLEDIPLLSASNLNSLFESLCTPIDKTPTTPTLCDDDFDFNVDLFLEKEQNDGFIDDTRSPMEKLFQDIKPSKTSSMEKEYKYLLDYSSRSTSIEADAPDKQVRLRTAHLEQWDQRFNEFVQFRKEHGHALVPLQYAPNPKLSHWIKRQRCQYKLKCDGKHSTLTDKRLTMLDEIGFVWDSHSASWESKFSELCDFKKVHGHCFVPALYKENKQLAAWVKSQRRQLRVYNGLSDSPSVKCTLSAERVHKLLKIGLRFKHREGGESKFRSAKKGAVTENKILFK